MLPEHCASVMNQGPVLVFPPIMICADFVRFHCTGRWAVIDNIHGKDSGACILLRATHYHNLTSKVGL